MRADDLIRRSAALLEAEVDGELVALDAEQGTCFGFNSTATRVWQLIETPMTLSALCARLSEEFDTEPERCRPQVETLVAELQRSGLVSVEPTGG